MELQDMNGLGMNRTGRKMAPVESKKSSEGAVNLTDPMPGDQSTLAKNRIRYMQETQGLGTVPAPATLRGVFSALQEKILNGDHTFMDKLGERLAFERTGTRLYEALISKHQGSSDNELYPDIETLQRFCDEEKQHFHMLSRVMEEIGGDATAMTPSADVAGVASMGWLQVLSDPRTNFKQSLEIILQAELADNDSWEVLIDLAEDIGLGKVATQFQQALDEEQVHLETIRQWVVELNLRGSTDYKIGQ